MYFRLREQQVRHGHVGGESCSQHRLLQERRLHTRNPSETQTPHTCEAAGEAACMFSVYLGSSEVRVNAHCRSLTPA